MPQSRSINFKLSVPFLRLFYQKEEKRNDIEKLIAGRNIYPEILFAIVLFLSFQLFPYHLNSTRNIITFGLWIAISVILFSLALINAKTMLIPNVILKPLAALVILYQIFIATQPNNTSLLGSAVVGAIILGGVPYILFQLSKGSWIGGGDVKLGFIAGLLLGWRYALICFGLMILLSGLSFLLEYVAGKMTDGSYATRVPTGILWSLAIISCVLIGYGH
jgi:Flp pilus assembly protein protease CpaA